jgi:hypothetical protein
MVGIVRKRTRKLPKKVGYTGLTAQPQPQRQRGGYKAPTATSRESIQRAPEQPEQNSGGLLGNALAGKQAVDSIGGMYESGKDLNEGFSGLSNAYDKASGYLGDTWNNSVLGDATSGLSMPSFDMSMPDFFSGGGSAMSSAPVPSDFSMVNGSITSLGGDAVGANSAFAGGDMGGLLDGSEGMGSLGGDATTGLQGSGGFSQALPYANIALDAFQGKSNITGNVAGDTALRGALAYGSGGLSEGAIALWNMFA